MANIRTEGIPRVRKNLRRVGEKVGDSRPFFEKMYKEGFLEGMSETFANENRGRWEPLTPKYRAWKRKKGYPDRIGVRTGAMRDSLTTKGAPNAVLKISGNSAQFGTSVKYAHFFHRRRPLLDIAREHIVKWIERELRQKEYFIRTKG